MAARYSNVFPISLSVFVGLKYILIITKLLEHHHAIQLPLLAVDNHWS